MTTILEKRFEKMGARVRLREGVRSTVPWRTNIRGNPVRLDVRRDRRGEYFDLFARERARLVHRTRWRTRPQQPPLP